MKKIFIAVAMAVLSTSVFATDYTQVNSGNWATQSSEFGLTVGSGASTVGGAGSEVSGNTGTYGPSSVQASNTSFSTGTGFSSTTVGIGLTGGLGGSTGQDVTRIDKSAITGSEGLTGGLGGALGVTSTSIVSHTDNAGSTGFADKRGTYGIASFAGGAYSITDANAASKLVVDFKKSKGNFKLVNKSNFKDTKAPVVKYNNGFGNGDQDAPGFSLEHNNAENDQDSE